MLSIITEKTTKLTFHELNESNFQRNIVDGSVGRLVSIFSLTEEVTAGNISLMRRDHGDNFKVVRLKKKIWLRQTSIRGQCLAIYQHLHAGTLKKLTASEILVGLPPYQPLPLCGPCSNLEEKH